jgi:cytochrome b involved in lipid metabolism
MADVEGEREPDGTISYTLEEITRHTSEGDAWLVHSSRVYDVSSFLERHPGGRDILVKNCGKDVTELMDAVDVHKHSKIAHGWLKKYYIGKVREEVRRHFSK